MQVHWIQEITGQEMISQPQKGVAAVCQLKLRTSGGAELTWVAQWERFCSCSEQDLGRVHRNMVVREQRHSAAAAPAPKSSQTS
jgi:hypothetical protein